MAAIVETEKQRLDLYRQMCRESLRGLCWNVLMYRDWDAVHDDMLKFLLRPARRKLLLVPRGHLKTSMVTKAMAIQKLLVDPNARILIANQVWDKAREMLHEIKGFLTDKSCLPLLFGKFESGRWNADDIEIRQRTKSLSAPTIGTTGVEAEMTSTHYDLIIADDLQGLQNCQTKEQREKVKGFYRSLIDLLEQDGMMIVVGTRWHQDDLYSEIMEKESEFYDVMVRAVIEDGQIIFPKKFSKRFDTRRKSWSDAEKDNCMDFINYLKKSKGSEFYAQYMNNPVDEETQIFKKGYLKYFQRRPDDINVVMAVDPAISQKQWADNTAIVVTAMDKKNLVYVLDYLKGQWSPKQIIDNIFQMKSKWNPHVVGLETVGFQQTLKFMLEAEMKTRREYFPITEIKTGNQVTKSYRIKSLEPFYSRGDIYHASWMKDRDLETELLTFDKGKHDDLIDALSMCLPLLTPGGSYHELQIPTGSWADYEQRAQRENQRYTQFFKIW